MTFVSCTSNDMRELLACTGGRLGDPGATAEDSSYGFWEHSGIFPFLKKIKDKYFKKSFASHA